jgi:hypothetical protein
MLPHGIKSTDSGPDGPDRLDGDHSANVIPGDVAAYRFMEVRQLDPVKALM